MHSDPIKTNFSHDVAATSFTYGGDLSLVIIFSVVGTVFVVSTFHGVWSVTVNNTVGGFAKIKKLCTSKSNANLI